MTDRPRSLHEALAAQHAATAPPAGPTPEQTAAHRDELARLDATIEGNPAWWAGLSPQQRATTERRRDWLRARTTTTPEDAA